MRILALIMASLFLLPGCWDNVDLKDRVLVLGMGIDLGEDDRYSVCLQFDVPAGENGQEEPDAGIICGTGVSLSSALASIQMRIPREIFLGQLQAIVIGEELAREPMLLSRVIDDLLRDPKVDKKAILTVARGRAVDVVGTSTQLEPSAGRFLAATDRVRFGVMHPQTELWQFLRALETPGQDPMATAVMAGPDQIEMAGVALFDRYEFAGWLGPFETRGLMWLLGQGDGTTVTVGTGHGDADIVITSVRTQARVNADPDPQVEYRVSVVGNLLVKPEGTGIIDEATFRQMEQGLARTVSDEAEAAIGLMQRYNADAAGIGRQIYYRRPDLWRQLDWTREFPRASVPVEVTARINRQGMLN